MKYIKNKFLILILLLIFIFSFNTNLTAKKNTDIENAFSNFESSQNNEFWRYTLRNNHDQILRIEDKKIVFYNDFFDIVKQIKTPISENELHTMSQSKDGTYVSIKLKNKDIYNVNLDTGNISKINNSKIKIFETNGFDNSISKLYCKYFSCDNDDEEKFYYGYYDLISEKFTNISELTEENLFDIYYQDKLKVIVKRNVDNSFSYCTSNKIPFYNLKSITAMKTPLFFSKLNVSDIYNDDFYYIEINDSEFGSLIKYNLSTNKKEILDIALKDTVKSISVLDNENLLIRFEYIKNTIFLGEDKNSNLKKIFNQNTNRIVSDYSMKNKKLLYFEYKDLKTKSENSKNIKLIFHDLNNNRKKILEEKTKSNLNQKTEFLIKDTENNDLYFYLYETPIKTDTQKIALMLHGGPFSRYTECNTYGQSQILCNLGYNVIELNYHGSEGLGKSYQALAGNNLPAEALDNIQCILTWINNKYNIDKNNIAVLGSSYGGYLSMMAKINFGDEFGKCVSMLPSTIENMAEDDISEYKNVNKNPDNYDNWELAKLTNQKIGIIYDPFDPVLNTNKNWHIIANTNNNIKIIDSNSDGHQVKLSTFKKAVYYLLED
jgi:hypothetical protein